jgi:hypothetical protein
MHVCVELESTTVFRIVIHFFGFNFNINDYCHGLTRSTYIKKVTKSIATDKISLYQSGVYLN